jgi:hypothetical protein
MLRALNSLPSGMAPASMLGLRRLCLPLSPLDDDAVADIFQKTNVV